DVFAPLVFDLYGKWTGGGEGTETASVVFTVRVGVIALFRGTPGNMLVRRNAGTMQSGVEGVVDDAWQRPGGTVAAGGSAHGSTVAEEKDVGGFEQDGIHESLAFRRLSYSLDWVRWANATAVQRPMREVRRVCGPPSSLARYSSSK